MTSTEDLHCQRDTELYEWKICCMMVSDPDENGLLIMNGLIEDLKEEYFKTGTIGPLMEQRFELALAIRPSAKVTVQDLDRLVATIYSLRFQYEDKQLYEPNHQITRSPEYNETVEHFERARRMYVAEEVRRWTEKRGYAEPLSSGCTRSIPKRANSTRE